MFEEKILIENFDILFNLFFFANIPIFGVEKDSAGSAGLKFGHPLKNYILRKYFLNGYIGLWTPGSAPHEFFFDEIIIYWFISAVIPLCEWWHALPPNQVTVEMWLAKIQPFVRGLALVSLKLGSMVKMFQEWLVWKISPREGSPLMGGWLLAFLFIHENSNTFHPLFKLQNEDNEQFAKLRVTVTCIRR